MPASEPQPSAGFPHTFGERKMLTTAEQEGLRVSIKAKPVLQDHVSITSLICYLALLGVRG